MFCFLEGVVLALNLPDPSVLLGSTALPEDVSTTLSEHVTRAHFAIRFALSQMRRRARKHQYKESFRDVAIITGFEGFR